MATYIETIKELTEQIKSETEAIKAESTKTVEKVEPVIDESAFFDKLVEEGIIEEGSKEEYQKFFKEKLEKFGVKSPAELDDEKKKEFFEEIKKEWKA